MVKIIRIIGEMRKKGKEPLTFKREYKVIKEEDAIEQVYSEFGGRYKVKRSRIIIKEIKEISPEEVTDPLLKAIL